MPLAHRHAGGLSLVELLVVLAIAAMLLAPLAELLSTAGATAAASTGQLALEHEAGFALQRIASVARAAPAVPLDPADGGGVRSGTWFDVSFELNGNKLTEKGSGPPHVLARDVAAFDIRAPQQDGQQLVQASITLVRGNLSYSSGISVRLAGLR